jgi:hypothetical protein
MEDRNSLFGDKSYRNFVGRHGLGRRNQRGHMLINVCKTSGHVMTNTWFKEPERRQAWKAPGDENRILLDYVNACETSNQSE